MTILDQIEDSISSSSYNERITYLKQKKLQTSPIERGVHDAMNVIAEGETSFVVYGEPQAGKTEFMIALCCKLIDQGYETIFILMNDNTDLEIQNFNRFHECPQLNPSPVKDIQLQELDVHQIKAGRQRIIFARKNATNLKNLKRNSRFMKRRVLIDDEADFATPDRNINKNREAASKINLLVEQLIQPSEGGIYIGVTATPGRLDLNNTFYNNSKKWVFLDPYESYKGRSFFFPLSDKDKARSDFILTKLSDDGDSSGDLKNAVLRFLIRAAFLSLSSGNNESYSMLVHTAGKTDDHTQDKKIIDQLLFALEETGTPEKNKLFEKMERLSKEIIDFDREHIGPMDLLRFVNRNIGRKDVVIINHKEDKGNVERAANPKSLFTFAIGGNIVSRGLTFNNLLTFFFSRNVKGKMQQNTYIQRARMFGNRSYSRHFELCVPESLFKDWAECFQQHELSLRLARSGHYVHIAGARTAAADSASIDKQYVIRTGNEREVGGKFKYSSEIDAILRKESSKPLDVLENLKNQGLIPDHAFSPSIIQYIRETSAKNQGDIAIVFRKDGSVQPIEKWADADVENISRAKGTIQPLIHRRTVYERKRHLILPIHNSQGYARFLYRSFLGHTILKNTIKH